MADAVDAVIEALKVALAEASREKDQTFWKVQNANRWINRLPGNWLGRWKDLKLKGNYSDEVEREQFIGHVRATLAYLESNKGAIASSGGWFARRSTMPVAIVEEPIDAEFSDVSTRPSRHVKGVKAIK